MNEGFLTYEHFYFIIKTPIKLVGSFHWFVFSMTLLSNNFYPFFLFFFVCLFVCLFFA